MKNEVPEPERGELPHLKPTFLKRQIINMTLGGSYMPQGTITYPTLGKGKSSSKVPAGRRYVSSLEGIYDAAFQGCWSDNHVFQVTMDPKFRQDVPKTQPQSFSLFAILLWHVSRTRATSGMSSRFSAHPNWCLIDFYSNTTTDLKPHQAYGVVSRNWAAQQQHRVVYMSCVRSAALICSPMKFV